MSLENKIEGKGENSKILDNFSFHSLEPNDKKIFQAMSEGDTIGIFQFQSPSIRKFIKKLKVDSFNDIVALNALHRPGALRSDIIEDYIKRKHNHQKVRKVNPIYDRITKDTLGLVIYQEQIMDLLHEMAGLPWKTADALRKVMGKSEGAKKFLTFSKRFAEGCEKKGTMGKAEASKLFREFKNFGAYGFVKAHSVGYSLLAYYMMWGKTYYPLEFYTALMNHSSEAEIKEYVEDCRKRGIEVRGPSVQTSQAEWSIQKGG